MIESIRIINYLLKPTLNLGILLICIISGALMNSKKRISMRKIREIMRLKYDAGLSNRQIAKSTCISSSTVSNYLRDAQAAKIDWEVAKNIGDKELEIAVFGQIMGDRNDFTRKYIDPDWEYIFNELKRKNVTKILLWQEYKNKYGKKAYSYSQFCNNFNTWRKKHNISMKQVHKGGEKLFVDYAGHTMPITDPNTGEETQVQIFLAVLGASNLIYAEASFSQKLSDWIASHVRTLDYIGGVPQIIVPDNLKSAVKKAHKYDPDLNPTYQNLAEHYDFAVIPARPYKPKDKSKVEVGVQIVERKILAKLRDKKFFSLGELNKTIRSLIDDLNELPFQKLPGTRREKFLQLDKPNLKPLPKVKYQYTEIKTAKVHVDYHVEVDRHYYSVPYTLIKEKVDIHVCNNTISIYHDNKRIVTHPRSTFKGRHTTISEHMPEKHKFKEKWTPERMRGWAESIGEFTFDVIDKIIQKRQVPEQAYRSCLAILTLAKKFSNERLERSCKIAIDIGAPHRKNIESILKNGLDNLNEINQTSNVNVSDHDNIRGQAYYS